MHQRLVQIEHQTLFLGVFWYVEATQLECAGPVVDELAATNAAGRLPHKQSANGVLPQDRIKQAADLFLTPNKGALDVGKPEAAVFIRVVQETDDLANGLLLILHACIP